MVKQFIKNRYRQVVESRDRRIAKSMVVAVSCEIVKFMNETPVFCSCKDFEIQIKQNKRHICKHQRAIVLAENYGLVTKQNSHNPTNFEKATVVSRPKSSSYKNDKYSF